LKLYSGHEILKLDIINTKNESHEIDAEIKLKGDLRVEGGRVLKKFTKWITFTSSKKRRNSKKYRTYF